MKGRRLIHFTGNFEEAIIVWLRMHIPLLSGARDAWRGMVPFYTIDDIGYPLVGATLSETVGWLDVLSNCGWNYY